MLIRSASSVSCTHWRLSMTSGEPMSRTLAVIPARGGSKRIHRKNIRPFLGVPLLARTVALLQESRVIDRIIVSTDDDEIAAVAVDAGAEAPFRRPAPLADDTTGTLPVIQHAVQTMQLAGESAAFVCCVYPAAVLARAEDFRKALALLRESDADYVFAATSFAYPIQRALRQTVDGGCSMFWPQHAETRSQDLEPAFHDAGQFYWGTREAWFERRPLFAAPSRMLIVPRYRVQDIDTVEDWKRAELLFTLLQHDTPA